MSNELTSGDDIREVVKFAAYMGRIENGMDREQAYREVYGEEP